MVPGTQRDTATIITVIIGPVFAHLRQTRVWMGPVQVLPVDTSPHVTLLNESPF